MFTRFQVLFGVLSIVSILFFSCDDTKKKQNLSPDELAAQAISSSCINCHSHEKGGEQIFAPSFENIRLHYQYKSSNDRAKFIDLMKTFLLHPGKETLQIPEAREAFGPMPGFGMSEDDATAISAFIFDHEPGTDKWLKMEPF
jgi:hypothetical protein